MKNILILVSLCLFYFFCPEARADINNRIVSEYKELIKAAQQGNIEGQYKLFVLVKKNPEIFSEEIETAFALLTSAAKNGHVDAQFQLGAEYQAGRLIERDYERAKTWLTLASSSNHVGATIILGNNYALRFVNSTDEKVKEQYKLGAIKYYEKAYKQNKVRGGWSLGNFLLFLNHNSNRAESLLLSSAADGSVLAMKSLGRMYSYRWGETRDLSEYQKSLEWFERSTKMGNDTSSYISELKNKKRLYDQALVDAETIN